MAVNLRKLFVQLCMVTVWVVIVSASLIVNPVDVDLLRLKVEGLGVGQILSLGGSTAAVLTGVVVTDIAFK